MRCITLPKTIQTKAMEKKKDWTIADEEINFYHPGNDSSAYSITHSEKNLYNPRGRKDIVELMRDQEKKRKKEAEERFLSMKKGSQ